MSEERRGALVLAYGHRRYHRQAMTLALSLDRQSPGLHRTLVTDNPSCKAARLYHRVIALAVGGGDDCQLKLSLDQFSPYEWALYLDADALVVRPLEPLFDLFSDAEIGVIGRQITDGRWYGDVAAMRMLAGSDSVPKFNSGLMSIPSTPETRSVFARARELTGEYAQLGLDTFRGGIADEPLLSIALAEHGIRARDLTAAAAATPIGINGPLRLDVLDGRCSFLKHGELVEPRVIHFAADYSSDYRLSGAHYRRERCKLLLSERWGLSDRVAAAAAHFRCGLQCLLVNLWIKAVGRAPRDPLGFAEPSEKAPRE